MKKWWRQHWAQLALTAIILLAAFLRLYRLDTLPLGLHDDEVWNTYFGRYIITNGHDLRGRAWPILYTDKFGDYPPVLPMYLSGLTTYIFGVGALASRLPFALIGIVCVYQVYELTYWLTKKQGVALSAAAFLAVCPWHVILSRASAENIAALAVFLWGLRVWCAGLATSQKSRQRW